MNHTLQAHLDALKQAQRKGLLVLIDPDKVPAALEEWLRRAEVAGVDALLVGGSLTLDHQIRTLVPRIRALSRLPVILFPGNVNQVVPEADAILLLSLISGRNPDLLIGRHVEAAPLIHAAQLEVLPTGYLLIEAGQYTTVNYISQTMPIPREKPAIAMCTALAGQQLGLRLIYLDGGSGAHWPVPPEMIAAVAEVLEVPLVVGGGIRSAEQARQAWQAGADCIVVGTALESSSEPDLLMQLAEIKARWQGAPTPGNGKEA